MGYELRGSDIDVIRLFVAHARRPDVAMARTWPTRSTRDIR